MTPTPEPSTPSPSPTPTSTGTYATVLDLRDAFIAAGGTCDKWKAPASKPDDDLEYGSCGDGAALVIFRKDEARDEWVGYVRAKPPNNWMLLGDDWAISGSEAPNVAQALGGELLPREEAVKHKTLSDRQWKLLIKNPDRYAGDRIVVYGYIYQFDAATGQDSFLALTDPDRQSRDYQYTENASFVGPERKLANFVEGDMFVAKVTVLGSLSYDTQAGGNTTVPEFSIDSIKRIR